MVIAKKTNERCQKCGGVMIKDTEDDELHCLNCGFNNQHPKSLKQDIPLNEHPHSPGVHNKPDTRKPPMERWRSNKRAFEPVTAQPTEEKQSSVLTGLRDYEGTSAFPLPPLDTDNMSQTVPPKPAGGVHDTAWKTYWKDNRPAILADMLEMGCHKARKKWGIGGATWNRLKKQWEKDGWAIPKYRKMPKKKKDKPKGCIHIVDEESPKEPVTVPVSIIEDVVTKILSQYKHPFPSFPEFNNEWKEDVQINWLRCFRDMTIGDIK